MAAVDTLARGVCPNCKSSNADIRQDFVSCRTCGVHGDPAAMRWCDEVPVFREVAKENIWLTDGQLYKHGERFYLLAGFVKGCERVVTDTWCRECRHFMPQPVDRPSRKARKKLAGQDKAAGEEKELEL